MSSLQTLFLFFLQLWGSLNGVNQGIDLSQTSKARFAQFLPFFFSETSQRISSHFVMIPIILLVFLIYVHLLFMVYLSLNLLSRDLLGLNDLWRLDDTLWNSNVEPLKLLDFLELHSDLSFHWQGHLLGTHPHLVFLDWIRFENEFLPFEPFFVPFFFAGISFFI